MPDNQSILTSTICIEPEAKNAFAEWQSKLHAEIVAFDGFVSLEIESAKGEWRLVQRFKNMEALNTWRESKKHQELLEELNFMKNERAIKEDVSSTALQSGGVTEVFVTNVSKDMTAAYHAWVGKMHEAETKFPGFQRVYVQAPGQQTNGNWITFLQFDSTENLEHWLGSQERKEILREAQSMIKSIESHRVISPFAGWFSNLPEAPPAWKQAMITLLVLFPIVMVELKFLSPLTNQLNLSLGMFIGNVISVSLVSWPLMPAAIYFLKWWLVPDSDKRVRATITGTLVMIGLYLVEVAFFWRMFS